MRARPPRFERETVNDQRPLADSCSRRAGGTSHLTGRPKRHHPRDDIRRAGVVINPAITYFRAVRTIIGPSCLTAVFGMGTGVANSVRSPEDACLAPVRKTGADGNPRGILVPLRDPVRPGSANRG
jgi:hypothetical protein